MEEKFNVEFAKFRIEELKTKKGLALIDALIMLFVSVAFVVVGAITFVSNAKWGLSLAVFGFGFTFILSMLSFSNRSSIKKEIEALEKDMVKYFEKKLEESFSEFLDSCDKMREKAEERRQVLNISSRPTDICSNLKFRDEVSVNRYGKLKNKSLIADFLKEKIADENFDDGSIVPVTIEMAIEKFKNYDFVLRLPYETMLKRYEEKQELLDKYNEQKQKPKTKRTTKKK